jgi:hypothetical protein
MIDKINSLLVDDTAGAIIPTICGLWFETLLEVSNELFFGGQGCFPAVCVPIIKDTMI